MKFSVAMCTYNGAPYLREQLDSIAAQTRPPDELVVCDDRSSDGTRGIVEEFAAAAPFPVRLFVNEQNLGSTKNFEKAVGLCAGDLIALCDQDDVWLPAKLERTEAAFLAESGAGLVFADAEVVDERLRPLGYTLWQSLKFGPREQQAFRRGAAFGMLLTRNYVTGATMAFRAEFKPLVLPFREITMTRYGLPTFAVIHDWWIALLVAAAARLAPLDEQLIKYRQHPRQQLGIGPPTEGQRQFADLRSRAAARYEGFYRRELEFLDTVRARLRERGGARGHRAAQAELEGKMTHLRTRAELSRRSLRRVPGVLRELLTRRYFRYSNGVSSALKDLLR